MPTFRAPVDDAVIEVEVSTLGGKERVFFEGQLVSEKSSHLYMTVHSFNVETRGVRDVYEVNVIAGMTGPGFAIRKNGIIVAHEP